MAVDQSCSAIFIGLVLIQHWLKQAEATHNSLGSPPMSASQHPNVYIFETDENGNRQHLILPCSIDNPLSTVNYTWFRGDRKLPGSMVNGEGTLVIPNITEGEYASREGVDYYCIASDNIGFDVAVRSRTITVYYTYFDGFQRMAQSGTIEVSIPVALMSDVALECDVLDAKPPPQIKWYKDEGPIQEVARNNRVRFLDGGRYLYLRVLESSHLEQQYYCAVSNVNLNQNISAPTRYVLTDNLTRGVLIDYKQIGDLTAFVGNTNLEFAYVGGVFGNINNGTVNTLFVGGHEVLSRGNIGEIDSTTLKGGTMLDLEARVSYTGITTVRRGTLTIHQVPRITSNLQNERDHFTVEENLKYTCEFEGFPLPNVTFYFNGQPIFDDIDIVTINNTLSIPSPQVFHSGIYQCIISNEFGDDQRAWLLEIRQPISPQVQPYNLTALNAFDDRHLGALIVRKNGSTVNFSVDVVADPCPDIVWFFNGTRLGSSNVTFLYNNACVEAGASNPNWTFTLRVQLTADTSGSYRAKLTNIAGSVSLPKAYFTIPESVSIFGLYLNESCLKEGNTVSLLCDTWGFPRPEIEFRHDGTEIGTELYMMEFYDQASSMLTNASPDLRVPSHLNSDTILYIILITNVTVSAAGQYSCTAISESGSQTVTQQFDFCTVPVIVVTNFTSNPQIGESFFIECTVDGIPMPTISWMKDGDILDEIADNRIRIVIIPIRKYSRVEISEASINDNGVYECIASNIAGSASAPFLIELLRASSVSASLSLGLIVGITIGVTVLISAASFMVLVFICRLYNVNNKSTKTLNASTYSANVAYTGTLEHLRKLPDPLYDTIPYSDPAKVWTNEKEQIYKRAHIYEAVNEDIELTEQSFNDATTVNPTQGNADEIQISKNDDNDSHNEDGKCRQRSPEIEGQVEQATTLHSDPQKLKYPHTDYKSEVEWSMIKEDIKAEIKPNADVNKDLEMGWAGNDDDDEPLQIYAPISVEHKAKKRKKMLQKQQKEDQKEENKMEEMMGSKKLKKKTKIALDNECNELDEENKVNPSKDSEGKSNWQCA